jgi:membrane protein DedA with SNARE-associated domain
MGPTRTWSVEHFISSWGYLAVFVLTVAEAACIPIPSELTLGLAGALASGATLSGAVDRHPLNLALVIVVGVVGELVGSFIAYMVGRTGGRALVDRFGKYLLLTNKDLDRAEAWFERRGDSAVLIGRVVPVVRTFISFPAGVAEMPVVAFGAFTAIGVTVWVGVLAGIGYTLGSSYHSMVKAFGDATYVVAALVVVAVVFVVVHRFRAVRADQVGRPGRDGHGPGGRPVRAPRPSGPTSADPRRQHRPVARGARQGPRICSRPGPGVRSTFTGCLAPVQLLGSLGLGPPVCIGSAPVGPWRYGLTLLPGASRPDDTRDEGKVDEVLRARYESGWELLNAVTKGDGSDLLVFRRLAD